MLHKLGAGETRMDQRQCIHVMIYAPGFHTFFRMIFTRGSYNAGVFLAAL